MDNTKKVKSRLVQFRVSEQEGKMIDALCERFGTMTSEYIRGLLREKFMRVFPMYVAQKKGAKPIIEEQQLTPEQACEQAGGNIMTKEGIPQCAIKISSSMMRYVPLSKPELFKK